MFKFILKDTYSEPNGESYDYLVTIYDANCMRVDILFEEIQKFFDDFLNGEKEYDNNAEYYLKEFLDNKGVNYKIELLKNVRTIYY